MTALDDQQRRSNFYSVLQEKLQHYRDAKQHLDRFLSTDFNVFKWIEPKNKDLLPDQIRRFEKRRSAIIADLLKPSGSHGQKRKFLDAFLRQIEKDDLCDKQLREVATEYRIEKPEGYIDVLVDFRTFVIAIENKPWADDGDAQLSNYLAYLKNTYKDRFCLIYLTQKDRLQPPSKSIEEDECSKFIQNRKLLLRSYNPDILEWLKECCRLCESDKFRWFLRDFMDHINGGQTMAMRNERDIILDHALENKENLEIALDVGSVYDDLRRLISEAFYRDLQRCLEKHLDLSQWEFITLFGGSSFGCAKKSWGQRYIVGMTLYDDAQAKTICFGVLGAKKKSSKGIAGLKKAIDTQTMKGKSDPYWEWYCDLKPYWDPEKTLVEMKYNRDAIKEKLCESLVKISKNSKAMKLIDEHVKRLNKEQVA